MLKVKKNNQTKTYVGNELIKFVNSQVKKIFVIKNGVKTLVWQYDISAPTVTVTSVKPTSNGYVYIQGTVSDSESGINSMKVDGINCTISGNNWSVTLNKKASQVPFNSSLVCTDNAGNTKNMTIKLLRGTKTQSINLFVAPAGHGTTSEHDIDGYFNFSSLAASNVIAASAVGTLYMTDVGRWTMTICDSNKNAIAGKTITETNNDSVRYTTSGLKIDISELSDSVKQNGYFYLYAYGYDHDSGGAHLDVGFVSISLDYLYFSVV